MEERFDYDGLLEANEQLREQNRVLDGALRLVLESWVNGRKVMDGIGMEVLTTVRAALTATSQPQPPYKERTPRARRGKDEAAS